MIILTFCTFVYILFLSTLVLNRFEEVKYECAGHTSRYGNNLTHVNNNYNIWQYIVQLALLLFPYVYLRLLLADFNV